MANLTTKIDFLGCNTRRHKSATINGMNFRFQNLTEREKGNFERQILNKKGGVNIDARKMLIIATLVDDDDKPLLNRNDMSALDELDGNLTGKLFEAASGHCGFGDTEIEDLEKNSEALTAYVEGSLTV